MQKKLIKRHVKTSIEYMGERLIEDVVQDLKDVVQDLKNYKMKVVLI